MTSDKEAPAETKEKAPEKVEEKALSTEDFSNDNVKVTVKRFASCKVELVVEGGETLIKNAKKKAIRDIAKEVSIPGFRKGKAPAAMIEKKFPEAVKEGMEKAFADTCFQEGNSLAKVPVLNGNSRITFKMISMDDKGGSASYSFETEPTIPDVAWDKFKLETAKKEEITDEKVDETIRNLQMFYATWNQVHDRPVQEGDFVVLDIDDLDQDPPVQAFSNARFEVKDKKMAKWMRDLVIGKSRGESVEGKSAPDADESDEVKKEFKEKKVKIFVKGIEEPVLPELNDEFAARVGVKTADEMKERIKALLIKQEDDKVHGEERASIADQIYDVYQFDIPASILEQEANHRMSTYLKQPGVTKKWNDEMSEEEKETKKEEIKTDSLKAIRLFYVCRKIIADQKIKVSEDELSPSYDSMLEMMFADPARVNYRNQSKQQQAMEYSKFMMAKAQDYIISQVKK